MKKVLCAAVVLCVINFVCFGLSYAILGRRYSNSYAESLVELNGWRNIFDHHITGYDGGQYSWKINNDFRNININSAGANTFIEQWDGDQISVEASVPDGQKINISAYYTPDDSDLIITVAPPNISFWDSSEFGIIDWLEDIFTYSGNITVTIKFPKTIYDALIVQQGSGYLSINEFYAHNNDISIGSGTFSFDKKENFTADSFTVDLGSGKAFLINMQTDYYYLDIGSGNLKIDGLTGAGTIDMGSGKCAVVYAEYGDWDGEGLTVDMGSGALDIYLPEDSGVTLETNIGSGVVDINALGIKDRITDDKSVILGDGRASMYIDMGSGKVNIRETSAVSSSDFVAGAEDSDLTSSSGFSNAAGITEAVPEAVYGEVTETDVEYQTEIGNVQQIV